MIRNWYPGWWRAVQQWWIQRNALPIAAPLQLRNSCARDVDAHAVARVLGARLTYLPYSGIGWPTPPPLREGASVEASWSSTITVKGADLNGGGGTFPLEARAAWVSDIPEKPMRRYREVMLMVQPFLERGNPIWRWESFAIADAERVCR